MPSSDFVPSPRNDSKEKSEDFVSPLYVDFLCNKSLLLQLLHLLDPIDLPQKE